MYMYAYIHAHTHAHIHTYMHTRTRTCIHTYIHTYIHAHTHTHTHTHTYIHTYIHTHTHTHTHTDTYTHPHAYMHTYKHTYIHKYIHIFTGQVHYMAFLHPLSCPYLDYLISDRIVSDPASLPKHHEHLVLVPPSFLVTDHAQMSVHPNAPTWQTLNVTHGDRGDRLHDTDHYAYGNESSGQGICGKGGSNQVGAKIGSSGKELGDNFVSKPTVLSNFNALYKMDPSSMQVWARTLELAPSASLWLQEWNPRGASNLRHNADILNIDQRRLIFTKPTPTHYPSVWNAQAALADVHIDTLIYNSVTLTTDLLWLGVPSVTLPGERFCARVGASLTISAGVPELIARTPDDMARLAARLLSRRCKRGAMREKLARNRRMSALFDTKLWVRRWERALRMLRALERLRRLGHIVVAE
jgi:hypothetical protein